MRRILLKLGSDIEQYLYDLIRAYGNADHGRFAGA
jgi:hypothetical protein